MGESVKAAAPLVSVIMPAYNASEFIADSIQSVLEQTVSETELIVIDDCSTDETAAVVRRLAEADARIRLLPNERNLGTAQSRNRGLDHCRGTYAAFLDSDDIWHPKKLEKQLERIRETGADLVYTSYAIVDASGRRRCEDFLVPGSIDLDGLLKENVIGCSTVLLSHKAAGHFRFRNDFYHEDYVLWLQMLRSGCTAAGVREVLVDYRFHSDSRAANKLSSAAKRWQIYRSYLGLSRMKSIRYLSHYALAGLKKYKRA